MGSGNALGFYFKHSERLLKSILQSNVIRNTVHDISLATAYRIDGEGRGCKNDQLGDCCCGPKSDDGKYEDGQK